MFKFAIILGCALLATSVIAGVVDRFDPAEVISRIDAAVDEIGVKTRDVGKAVLQIGMRGENSAHAYVNSLKASMNSTLKSIQLPVADWKKYGGKAFKDNNCGTYLDDLMDLASIVQDEIDGCALVSIIPSAFKLSSMFNTSATAIERLGKIKALVAKCDARNCQGLEGEEVIENPTAFRNAIVHYVQQLADHTSATIQIIQDDYQQSVQDTDTIYNCIRHTTDYHQFIEEASHVLLDTVECVVGSIEEMELVSR